MGVYTAVISDLHLTDSEPSRPRRKLRHPLWKKFKSKEFFVDRALTDFVTSIQATAAETAKQLHDDRPQVELVLNGDIFDFDSVMAYPEKQVYKLDWIETRRGLYPKEDRSVFKIDVILEEHAEFINALSEFIKNGHQLILIPGNHDVELHFPKVQTRIINALKLNPLERTRVRFVSWYYISNNDTLIEHGHQQDPYCMCENPLNPFLVDYNELTIRLPFGNVACRYIMNGMGLFNPHVEKNYIMSLPEYLRFFFKYLIQAQPLILWTWLWGSVATLYHVTVDRFSMVYKPTESIEDRVEREAQKSNSSPRVLRELQELFVIPAVQNPWMIAKELWLDRAFLMLAGLSIILFFVAQLKDLFGISLWWAVVAYMFLLPFFLFYARSISSLVSTYKEPDEELFAKQSEVTGLSRIIYGHTHIPRHEYYGAVEHLNSGTWSPGFTDVECTTSDERNNFVWIAPSPESADVRKAELKQFLTKK